MQCVPGSLPTSSFELAFRGRPRSKRMHRANHSQFRHSHDFTRDFSRGEPYPDRHCHYGPDGGGGNHYRFALSLDGFVGGWLAHEHACNGVSDYRRRLSLHMAVRIGRRFQSWNRKVRGKFAAIVSIVAHEPKRVTHIANCCATIRSWSTSRLRPSIAGQITSRWHVLTAREHSRDVGRLLAGGGVRP